MFPAGLDHPATRALLAHHLTKAPDMIDRDTLNRLMDLRDAARDGYYDANFGALAQMHIGIDLGRAGWALIPDTEVGIATFLRGREIIAAAVIRQIAPSLGLRVCEAEPSVVVVAQIAVRAEAAPAGVTA